MLSRGDVKDERLRSRLAGRLYELVEFDPRNASAVMDQLLHLLTITPYPRKTSFAYLLQRLYWSMPLRKRRAIIRHFLASKDLGIKRRAYVLIHEDWSPFWIPEIERTWYERRDQQSACMVLNLLDTTFLVDHIDELTADLNDGVYWSRLYIRTVPIKPTLLRKLRKVDGITYAYVAARLGKKISKSEAQNLLQQYEADSRLGILAWSLGKLGHWDLLKHLADTVSEIEERKKRQQYEEWGMSKYL